MCEKGGELKIGFRVNYLELADPDEDASDSAVRRRFRWLSIAGYRRLGHTWRVGRGRNGGVGGSKGDLGFGGCHLACFYTHLLC